MNDLLTLTDASFGYLGRRVVSGVDFKVRAGDFTGIVGPNGAGKTTLFRGMLGLIPPQAGKVSRSTQAIGYVPQRDALDPIYPLCVQEVVEMGGYGRLNWLRRLGREERSLARDLVERVGLEEKAKAPFTSLSGGQRQRVLIARALMVKPRLLLLDEPTSGVDQDAELQILELLHELNREGLAILIVSHQLALVRDAVREVLLVCGGRVESGSPRELLRPENLDRLHQGHIAPEPTS